MKLVWSPRAVNDLGRIADLIALDKRESALRWAQNVERKVLRLKRFPESGRIVPELGRPEIREVVVGSYRIIYKRDKQISILTVFHGARSRLPGGISMR